MQQYASRKTDIFLTQKLTYFIPEPLDNVWHRLNSFISDRRWFPRLNASGKIHDDGSFTLTPQWSFVSIRWIENSPAYLSGKLHEVSGQTAVHITLRPNSGFVIFLYFFAILFVLALMGVGDFIEAPRKFKLLFYPFFGAILYGTMYWQTASLRRNFEKILEL